jgi:hypothetical protein
VATKEEKSVHLRIAEEVLAKVKKSVRDKLTIDTKASYSAIRDSDTWLVRLTPKLLEANKKRITEEQLESAGLHEVLKDAYHRAHHLGVVPAAASGAEGEKIEEPLGGGVEELARAVEVAAKPVKESK